MTHNDVMVKTLIYPTKFLWWLASTLGSEGTRVLNLYKTFLSPPFLHSSLLSNRNTNWELGLTYVLQLLHSQSRSGTHYFFHKLNQTTYFVHLILFNSPMSCFQFLFFFLLLLKTIHNFILHSLILLTGFHLLVIFRSSLILIGGMEESRQWMQSMRDWTGGCGWGRVGQWKEGRWVSWVDIIIVGWKAWFMGADWLEDCRKCSHRC